MKLVIPSDCDNAFKRRIIRDLNIAFAKGDVDALKANFHNDITWEMIGDRVLTGIQEVTDFLISIKENKATALELKQILTHGKHAAASGILTFTKDKVYFHDFYEFSSAGSSLIKKISSMARDVK